MNDNSTLPITKSSIPIIQAMRGIAVLLVMLFHASQMSNKYFHYNFLGVSDMGRSGGYAFFSSS